MNQLSWLIYIAEVSGNLGGLLAALAIISSIVWLLLAIATVVAHMDDYVEDNTKKSLRKALGWTVAIALLLATLASLIPSKETVYAIAASEMGEEVLKSPTAGKAVKALDAWLDKQIANNQQPEQPQQ